MDALWREGRFWHGGGWIFAGNSRIRKLDFGLFELSEENSTPSVRLRGVGKSFGGVSVLRSADLDILPSEIHGLVGKTAPENRRSAKLSAAIIR